ncbi:MAG: T9SS type A sorting domain-containing protein [Crocinitomicaceae bacterium]|nr:T9SS type A sorting domain-containing protein [Flavobacteriales bacterium]NQZ36794.1 T9SS type A sorting domain-containing protein [Crocinitomicaceae bacterium]
MKKIISLIIASTLCTITFGQKTMIWDELISLPGNAGINTPPVGMVTDANNNVYVTAISNNGLNTDVNTKKFDECGTLLWENTYDSGTDDDVVGIGIDNTGNIYLAGNHNIAVQKRPLTIKYNSAGALIWSEELGIIWGAEVRSMTVDGNGNMYFTGNSIFDVFIRKYNSSGVQQWLQYYDAGSSLFDEGKDIHLSGGSVYVTGVGNDDDILTLKYSTTGTFNWAQTTGGSYDDYGAVIKTDGFGNVYVLGRDQTSSAVFRYRTIKYNSSGTELWNIVATPANPAKNATPSDLAIDGSGNVFITGSVWDAITASNTAMLTMKYNVSGTLQWYRTYSNPLGGSAYAGASGKSLFIEANGDVVVFGAVLTQSFNTPDAGCVTYSPAGVQQSTFYRPSSYDYNILAIEGSANDYYMYCHAFGGGINPHLIKLGEFPAGFQAHIYPTASFCEGDSTQLNATVPPGSTFSWSPTTGLSDPTSLTPWVTWGKPTPASQTITYTLTLNNCEAVTTVDITNMQVPDTYLRHWDDYPAVGASQVTMTNNATINGCLGDTILLGGTNDQWYDWFNLNDPSYYDWSSGLVDVIEITESGIYYAQVYRTATGCMDTTVFITVNLAVPPVVANASSAIICTGDQVTLTGSGADSYSWDNGVIDGTAFTPISGTTYMVTGTDANGCENTDAVTITTVASPTVNLGSNQVACAGTTITLDAGSGFNNYNWSTGATTQTISANSSSIYSVIVTDGNGCTASDNVAVTVNPLPTVDLGIDQDFCSGNSVSLNAGSGFSNYNWSTGATTQTISVNSSSTYSVTVTDGNGCGATDDVVITVNALPTVNLGSDQFTCIGSPITLDAGSGFSNYSWSNGGTTQTISANSSSTYSVVVTDGNGCEANDDVVITVNALPTITASGTATICDGESTSIIAGGASTYTWNNGAGTGTSVSVSPNTTTTYTVTGIDANSCSNTAQVLVTVNSLPTIAASGTATICDGESTSLTASGASSYSWNNGAGTGNSVSVSPSTTMTYIVTGTDANSCSNTSQVTVTVNPLPTITVSGITAICEGESTNLTASGASTYSWDNGAGTGTSVSVSPNTTTTYTITGIDANTCSNTAQVTVTVNPLPTITVSGTATICAGESTSLTANGGSTYTWDNGAGTGTSVSVSPNTTTTYIVTGTDANTCSNTSQVTVTVNPLPTITASGTATICDGESTSIAASGASTYTWDNGAGTGTSVSVSPSSTTTYTVIGTDANTCSNTAQVTVTVNPLPNVLVSQIGSVLSAQNVNGGVTYQWIDCNNNFATISGETNQVYSPTVNGNYAVIINENSCADTSTCYMVNTIGFIENNFGNELIVYPNPTYGDFSIDLGENYHVVTVTLRDLKGKLLLSKTYYDNQLLNLKLEEPAGVYLLLIESEDQKAVIRLIIE